MPFTVAAPPAAATLAPGAEITHVLIVERWSLVGSSFTIDLARALATPAPVRVAVERFTTTTYGLISLD